MTYKIIGDSSTDLTDALRAQLGIEIAPLSFTLDGVEYIDNDDLDVDAYMATVNASSNTPKSACPSINDYMSHFEGDHEGSFVVTLSSELSGSYNSAMNARDMFLEDHPDKKVHIVDSRAAASAQTLIALKLDEILKEGVDFEEAVERIEKFRDNMQLLFVLDKIDTLEKNGRLSRMKAKIVRALNLKLILRADNDGSIDLFDKARGTKKALKKMVASMGKIQTITEETVVCIAHCQAPERAENVKQQVMEAYGQIEEVIIVPTKGLSSTYANTGGVIVAF